MCLSLTPSLSVSILSAITLLIVPALGRLWDGIVEVVVLMLGTWALNGREPVGRRTS